MKRFPTPTFFLSGFLMLLLVGASACGVKSAPLPPLEISAETSDAPSRVASPTPTPEAR